MSGWDKDKGYGIWGEKKNTNQNTHQNVKKPKLERVFFSRAPSPCPLAPYPASPSAVLMQNYFPLQTVSHFMFSFFFSFRVFTLLNNVCLLFFFVVVFLNLKFRVFRYWVTFCFCATKKNFFEQFWKSAVAPLQNFAIFFFFVPFFGFAFTVSVNIIVTVKKKGLFVFETGLVQLSLWVCTLHFCFP